MEKKAGHASQVTFPSVRIDAKPNDTTKTTTIHTAVHVACVDTALSAVVTPTMPDAEKKSMPACERAPEQYSLSATYRCTRRG